MRYVEARAFTNCEIPTTGKSGLRVSELCLGTMTFGQDWGWGSARDEARKIYDAFRAAGGNFVDTANVYTNGTSETFLGEFLAGQREAVVLATKYTNAAPSTDPNAAGNQRKSMVQSLEASLRRLKTDYIVIGARKIGQFEDNLESLTLALDQEQVRLLDAASDVQLGFPHDFYRQEMVQGLVYGGLRDKIIT